MTLDDQIRATVAQGMCNSETVADVLDLSFYAAHKNAETHPMLHDIASAISSASEEGITQAHRETIATRLLHTLEGYARTALTENAESDTPQPDDEENDDD